MPYLHIQPVLEHLVAGLTNDTDYTFRVRAANHNGVWSDQETTLKISVDAPPWLRWWARSGTTGAAYLAASTAGCPWPGAA